MGLDMFLYGKKNFTDEKEDAIEIGYWRKHPDLHSYIEKLYYDSGGDANSFNCVKYKLSKEEIEDIINRSRERTLPLSEGGMFFGESEDEYNDDTVEIFTEALKHLEMGYVVYYDSWW